MKELNGAELVGFIKERQAKAVRGLRQAWHTQPKLAIVTTTDDAVSDRYIQLKQSTRQTSLVHRCQANRMI